MRETHYDRPPVTIMWPTQRPQRQDSLTDQLKDLHRLAARYGMYDAADWLWKQMQAVAVPAGTATSHTNNLHVPRGDCRSSERDPNWCSTHGEYFAAMPAPAAPEEDDPYAKCEHGRPVGLCARCPVEDDAEAPAPEEDT